MELLGKTFFFDWEVSLMIWLQDHIGAFGVKLAEFFTEFGEPMVIIFICGLIYWGVDKKYGRDMILHLLAVMLWAPLIKNIAQRRRPYFDHEAIDVLHPVEAGDVYDISLQGFSFPSMHASNSITFYTLVGRRVDARFLKIICWLLPFLVGISRVVLGVHYPTDVLFGWAFGMLVLLLMDLLIRRIPDFRKVWLILVVTGLPGFFFCKSADFYTVYGLMLGTGLAFIFEERRVNFQPAKNFLFALLRVVLGGAVYLILSTLLKMPFPKEMLSAPTMTAYLIRTVRYVVIAFAAFGVYPLCFRKGKLDL